jgi:hypothetical protein
MAIEMLECSAMTPSFSSNQNERPALPEERLWRRVLHEGLKDKTWIGSTHFNDVCSLAGADPDYIRRKVG